MAGAAKPVPERVEIFLVARVHHHLTGDRVDLVAAHARLQRRRAGLDRLDDGGEGALDCRWRAILAGPAHIPHALKIRAVAFVLDAQVDMHQVAWLDQDIVARGGVAGLGCRAAVDDRAAVPAPGAGQAARAELFVNEAAELGLADARADLAAVSATISSVIAMAARMRSISAGVLRARSLASSGAALTSRSAKGVPRRMSFSSSHMPCVSPSAVVSSVL